VVASHVLVPRDHTLTRLEAGHGAAWFVEFACEYIKNGRVKKRPIRYQQSAAQTFEPRNLDSKPTLKQKHEESLQDIAAITRIAIDCWA
jgi:hypothetical protein